MLQITPHMKTLVAIEPADFRKGIDGLAAACKETLKQDPFAGIVFVFRNRRSTAPSSIHFAFFHIASREDQSSLLRPKIFSVFSVSACSITAFGRRIFH
jgi:hypothetical protein